MSCNIGGPSADWDTWMTIVQLLSNMKLDFVALQEVKPTFPNITCATTLAFPEWEMYCNPHTGGMINGVTFLVRQIVGTVVHKDATKRPLLYTVTQHTLGFTIGFPNCKPVRVLNYYGLQKPDTKRRQDACICCHDGTLACRARAGQSFPTLWCGPSSLI